MHDLRIASLRKIAESEIDYGRTEILKQGLLDALDEIVRLRGVVEAMEPALNRITDEAARHLAKLDRLRVKDAPALCKPRKTVFKTGGAI